MLFLNRINEKNRLIKALSSRKPKLIIIYGRRRCGKSTLIRQTLSQGDVYFMAQLADESVQRIHMAQAIGEKVYGFDKVVYPDWEALFRNLINVIKEPLTLTIDEFPYLVKSAPGLPSLIQKIVDLDKDRKFHLVLCGSSQQMMQGLVLDSSAALYGRADEIFKIAPLEAGWIAEALNCEPSQAVQEYSVWGGIPRYWELRSEENSFEEAVMNIVLDRFGILHEEPTRLFLDDMRESVQAFSILTVIGSGCNRLSEIAGRLNKPATHLSRPIDNLIQLGYIKREIPFGESFKDSKKSIYRISDPFMNFYFTFLVPNLSRLEMGLTKQVFDEFKSKISVYVSREWENLCRRCIPFQPINEVYFNESSRWWGSLLNREVGEIDIVAESVNTNNILVGECKWSVVTNPEFQLQLLEEKAGLLPFAKGKIIIPMLFVKGLKGKASSANVFLPDDVMLRLK